jgi:hypothetical protein
LFWTHLTVLLGDVALVESCFSTFGDSVSIGRGYVLNLRQTSHWLGSHFGHTQWNFCVTWVMWNLVLVHLETMSVAVQDRCMVCAKHTTCSKIILDIFDGTPR